MPDEQLEVRDTLDVPDTTVDLPATETAETETETAETENEEVDGIDGSSTTGGVEGVGGVVAAPNSEAGSSSRQGRTPVTAKPESVTTLVATAKPHVQQLVAYDQPDGTPIALPFVVPNPHQFGGPMTLMVTQGQQGDGWLKVQLPIRPNSQEGWINAQDFTIDSTVIRAEVDLSDTSVVVYNGSEVLAQTRAVVGSSATPTPVGTFYVAAKKRNSESYLGPWALALSSFSEAHETFNGGLPVIAIHGTSNPGQVGQHRSNGCIRIPNEIITFLAETVPLGAPVTVRA